MDDTPSRHSKNVFNTEILHRDVNTKTAIISSSVFRKPSCSSSCSLYRMDITACSENNASSTIHQGEIGPRIIVLEVPTSLRPSNISTNQNRPDIIAILAPVVK